MQTNTVVPSNLENMTTQGLFVAFHDIQRSADSNLPADLDLMNDLRAQQADSILVACEGQCPEDVSLATLSQLLSQLAHWCDRNGLQMTEALRLAAKTYSNETDAQGRQFSA